MDLCAYSNILGAPKEGIHSYRIFNIAIIDLGLTIIAAIILSYAFDYSLLLIFIILMVIGILLHKLFCVNTTITSIVFG